MIPVLLAVSLTALSWHDGHVRLTVPSTVQVREQKENFETMEYELFEGESTQPLLTIIDGGGAYELSKFNKVCLNGRQAWRWDLSGSGSVVVGEPGFWAVAAYWEDLSGERLDEAKALVNSIRLDFGATC